MTIQQNNKTGQEPVKVSYARRWAWVRLVTKVHKDHLSLGAKVAAVALSQYVNMHRQEAWPSHAEIARSCGCINPRSIRRVLERLEKLGFILIPTRGGGTRRRSGDGKLVGISCTYELSVPSQCIFRQKDGFTLTGESAYLMKPKVDSGVSNSDVDPVDTRTEDAATWTEESYEPSTDSVREPSTKPSNAFHAQSGIDLEGEDYEAVTTPTPKWKCPACGLDGSTCSCPDDVPF